MTIPNVTMRWCQNKARCYHCQVDITPGEPMVGVFFWNKGAGDRHWNISHCYHPNCWVAQGMEYLSRNPYVPYKRGRKRMQLTTEQHRQRFLLTRRYHAIVQRKGKLNNNSIQGVMAGLRLDVQIADLILDMQKLGGVPIRWIENLS